MRWRRTCPVELETLVRRCLQKKPNARYASMSEVEQALRMNLAAVTEPASGVNLKVLVHQIRRPRVTIPSSIILIVLASLSVLWIQRSLRARWARKEAIPAIERFVEQGEYVKAASMTRAVHAILPSDPPSKNSGRNRPEKCPSRACRVAQMSQFGHTAEIQMNGRSSERHLSRNSESQEPFTCGVSRSPGSLPCSSLTNPPVHPSPDSSRSSIEH